MSELRAANVVLRALERQDCHILWQAEESGDPPPTEHHRLGLASEGADRRERLRRRQHLLHGADRPRRRAEAALV